MITLTKVDVDEDISMSLFFLKFLEIKNCVNKTTNYISLKNTRRITSELRGRGSVQDTSDDLIERLNI